MARTSYYCRFLTCAANALLVHDDLAHYLVLGLSPTNHKKSHNFIIIRLAIIAYE